MASLPDARRIKSPPGWEDAKDVMSSTMWRLLVGLSLLLLAPWVPVDEDSRRATHADDGEACAASSDLVMLLSTTPVLESVAEEEEDEDALALALAAWLGLHMFLVLLPYDMNMNTGRRQCGGNGIARMLERRETRRVPSMLCAALAKSSRHNSPQVNISHAGLLMDRRHCK